MIGEGIKTTQGVYTVCVKYIAIIILSIFLAAHSFIQTLVERNIFP